MKVCIAEKPSVAREIAKVLGANKKAQGYFEGNGYQVTYTFGHLCGLFEPHDYKAHWKKWDLNNLPMLPDKYQIKLVGDKGVEKQFQVIQKLVAEADLVINCGDAGQEGELIQRWVLQQAGYRGELKRLWISSLTEEAIQEGFKALKPAEDFEPLYHAGFSRAIGDWLLGMNATRLYTLKYGEQGQVLSVGRVQTPTLAMIVERHRAIAHFKPQKYWTLRTTYRGLVFSCEKGKYAEHEAGKMALEKIASEPFEILSIESKKAKEYAPKLFDLTSLQVYCNTKFGYTAEETLGLAQKLYEKKLISYPRVDTQFLPNDVYKKAKKILEGLSAYKSLVTPLLAKKLRKSTKVFQEKKITDHHAIIPTGQAPYGLEERASKVYDIITRRFIAIFYPEAEFAATTVKGRVVKLGFKANGKKLIKEGWKRVFQATQQAPSANADDPESSPNTAASSQEQLPDFVKGEQGRHQPELEEKSTSPPRPFTEATLLRAMETAGKQIDDEEMRALLKENGIGRPSTRASIIETLFRRKYIRRNRKQVLPTELGMHLIDTIKSERIKSAEMTGRWEKMLREIESAERSPAQFVHGLKKLVDEMVYEVRSGKLTPQKPEKTKHIPCPKCGKGHLLKGKKAYGCSAYPKHCNYVVPFAEVRKKLGSAAPSPEQVRSILVNPTAEKRR